MVATRDWVLARRPGEVLDGTLLSRQRRWGCVGWAALGGFDSGWLSMRSVSGPRGRMPPIVSRAIPWHTTFRHADAFSRLLSFRNSTPGEACGLDHPAKKFPHLGL